MDAWLWWLCMAAPISMLLIYGDTILYLWIFWFLCSHAPSSLLLIQSSIIYIYIYIYVYYIFIIYTHIYIYLCMRFLPFSKSAMFSCRWDLKTWSRLEPAGSIPTVEEGGQARNDGKSSAQQRQMSRTAPVTGQKRSEPKVFTGIDLQLVTTKTGIV